MIMTTPCISLEAKERTTPAHRKEWDTFDERFSHCRKTLHFVAFRILGDSEKAAYAVENCRVKALRNLPRFEGRGAFGSWLLRLLIDEALSILHSDCAVAGVYKR